MKNTISFLLIFIWGLLTPSPGRIDGYKAISEAFCLDGMKFYMSAATGWVKYETEHHSKQDMELTANDICDYISNKSVLKKEIIDSTDNSIVVRGDGAGKIIMVSINNERIDDSSKYRQSLSIEITQQNESENIIDIRRRLKNCLDKYGIDPHIYIWWSKYMPGNIDVQKRCDTIDNILSRLSVENISRIEDRGMISVSGFCPHIDDYITCDSDRVNVNMACRYSSYDDKTFFLLGTPVICSEY